MINLEGDLDLFFTDFGVEATYNLKTITVLFDKNYKVIEPFGDGTAVESYGPAVTCKSSDVEGIKQANRFTVNNIDYYVKEVQDDGTGITVLLLSEDAV